MNAKKCDRCGSLYEIRHANVIEEFAEIFNVVPQAEELRKKMEADIDLCSECSGQLLKWLKGGEFE